MKNYLMYNIKYTVLPLYKYWVGGWSASESLPSNNLKKKTHTILCHSLMSVNGLCGTDMNPGQVYLLNHFIIYLSKKEI